MRTPLLIATALLLTPVATFQAAETVPPQPTASTGRISDAEIQRLIRQLGDGSFQLRELALQQLHAEGLHVIPHLRRALSHTDPEVRRRVQELIPALETAALLAPRRVTLKVSGKPLKEVFDTITQQTGYRMQYWGGEREAAYSFDMVNVPFWEAIDQISRQTGLVVQQGYSDETVRLNFQNAVVPYVNHRGPFRFVAASLQQMRHIDLSTAREREPSPRSETLTFSFTVFVEPKLPLLGLGEVKLEAAYDSERNSMLPPAEPQDEPGAPWGAPGMRWTSGRYSHRAFSMQSNVTLQRVSEKASRIKVLRGAVPVTLLANQNPVVITDQILKAKGLKKTIDQTTLSVEDIQELPNNQLQVKLQISQNLTDNDYSWTSSLYQRIEVLDEKDAKLPVYGTSWGGSGPNNVQLTFTYGQPGPNAPKPRKLIFHSWTTLQTLAPFEFTDLPLP